MNPKKSIFVLSRKNQSGQVAIFVALIFQILFVFFAMLINVGLLVHHKINLQQSTDLAAYYGAMKQAEMLNVMGHINFQIRQAWKLMTWRYRVLGTFGNASKKDPPEFTLPINIGRAAAANLTFSPLTQKCPAPIDGETLTTLPGFCIGHAGFTDWRGSGTETNCKIDCGAIQGAATTIPKLSNIGRVSVPGANAAIAVNQAIDQANQNLKNSCEAITKMGITQLARMLSGFEQDTEAKKSAIRLLAANLTNKSDKFLDLDGNLVEKGVWETLRGNLTEANLVSLKTRRFLSGISSDNGNAGECVAPFGNPTKFMSEITFDLVQFFMLVCDTTKGSTFTYESIYKDGSYLLNDHIRNLATASGDLPPMPVGSIDDVISRQLTVGFEKNPWCNTYYAVRTTSEPSIPFLPLAKIKLNAVAVAKPFGSSMGPFYRQRWFSGAANSDDNAEKVDQMLPNKKLNSNAASGLKANKDILPNYSNYIGDTLGLADHELVGIYHSFLLARGLNKSAPGISVGQAGTDPTTKYSRSQNPIAWPKFVDWGNINKPMTDPEYDPLVMEYTNKQNSHIRDIEISVVAPNQFDLTYYPIEPDFYNNYYKGRLDNSTGIVDKIKANVGVSGQPIFFRPDYGFNSKISTLAPDFSVRHQLGIVAKIFKDDSSQLLVANYNGMLDKYFTFNPTFPATLLTSWTYLNLNVNDYSQFSADASNPVVSMPFGQCKDSWYQGNTYGSITAAGNALPPTTGNCVTGGRTGYSVKIVSPALYRQGVAQGPIGGEGTDGALMNPLPDNFLTGF